MSEPDQGAPKQTTEKGATIPVPTREAFLRDMAKVAPRVERELDHAPSEGATEDDEQASS